MADANEFVHRTARHVLCDDDWAGDTINLAKTGLAVLITNFWEVFLCVWNSPRHVDESMDWRDEIETRRLVFADYVITCLVTWWAVDLSGTYASLPLLQHIILSYATKIVRIR